MTSLMNGAMEVSPTKRVPLKFLIYGRTGCIGGLLGNLCEKQGLAYDYGKGRLEERSQLVADMETFNPTHVLHAAGATGTPNVCWCESHKHETIRTNVVGTLNLVDVCREKGVHVVYYGSGCLLNYDPEHLVGSRIGFTEEDKSNYSGSFYSKTKAMVEELLKEHENVCVLRVRFPILSDLNHPRNFIKKIISYDRVIDVPNSMTVLEELLPFSIEMAKRNLNGVWNFTNPGVLSHNEVLQLYKEYVDPSFQWVNFTIEEQAKLLVANRCNNELDSSKLKREFPEMMSLRDSLIKYIFEQNKTTH